MGMVADVCKKVDPLHVIPVNPIMTSTLIPAGIRMADRRLDVGR